MKIFGKYNRYEALFIYPYPSCKAFKKTFRNLEHAMTWGREKKEGEFYIECFDNKGFKKWLVKYFCRDYRLHKEQETKSGVTVFATRKLMPILTN